MPTVHGKRPCRFCRRWFLVDPRLGERQLSCSAPECQVRRQAASQEAWLASPPGYFRGRAQKHRVYREKHPDSKRLWRANHPEVRERERVARARRRKRAQVRRAVEQESIALQLIEPSGDTARLPPAVEQESIGAQLHILIGVASQLPPAGAQEPIAGALSQWHDRGRRLLGGLKTDAQVRND